MACGPRAHIPPLAAAVAHVDPAPDSIAERARRLAPTLYLHPDETFPLVRVVAIQHPRRRIIAYHLLWRDDAHGAWIPFTRPTDQEIIWVEYDEAGIATTLRTYWHGTIVSADWRGLGTPAVDVQWGKHGNLPRETVEDDLPRFQRLWTFYLLSWALPDLWLGRLNRRGPLCFCGGLRRYREFSVPLSLDSRLDAVVVTDDPHPVLQTVFGAKYSRKPPWPEIRVPLRAP